MVQKKPVQKKSHLQQDTVVRVRRRKRNHLSNDLSQNRDNTSNPDSASSNDYTEQLFTKLGHTLTPEHLVEALTHKSFTHEHEGAPSYERLEFLGDAVLELVVTETLFSQHPDFSEGQMAKIRAKAVSEEVLAPIARDFLQVGPMILLGNGEADDHGAEKDSILCDIVESLIGAVFIEHGIDAARQTVHSLIDTSLERVSHEGPSLDWKTSLAKISHELGINELTYRMEVGGPDYAQVFTAYAELTPNVTSDKLKIDTSAPLGSGQGSTKRKAQMIAAENAWKVLNELTAE
ncbi:ribonuclease III [Alloscardovia theropitheci]|uniref:Ribonuclease 3 n=1 Tax=Alloscardovia theropitheci TaxID=2496842 RepID=A0A4R0QWD9_9BIFI|nr:ribonuclease III [Alloscardovia theropitheci]TCD54697.1 ribonuclease III [Alloscardovia theropitheci]